MINFVLHFFESGCFSEETNMTWVVLIPKFDGAEKLEQFRPISMVGSLYKIIAKY